MNTKNLLITLCFCLYAMMASAQGFTKVYGGPATDIGSSALQMPDGGFVLATASENYGAKGFDMVLMRTDFEGKFLWAKNFGGPFKDQCFDIARTIDGGLVMGGYTQVTDSPSNFDNYIVKTDANGNEVWARKFGNSIDDKVYAILSSKVGNIVGVGSVFNGNDYDASIFLMNPNGTVIWSFATGGIGNQEARDVIEVADGYIFVGTTRSKSLIGQEDRNVLFVKVSKSGALMWFKSYGEAQLDEGNAVVEAKGGGFMIVGRTTDNIDLLAIKTDKDGNELWTKKYGGAYEDEAYGVVANTDGTYTITGSQATDAINIDGLIMKIDGDGNKIWSNLLGKKDNTETFNHILPTSDGGYLLTGTIGTLTNDVLCVKTNSKGVVASSFLKGKIYFDENENCMIDAGERALSDWLISITDKNKQQRVAYTKANGEYSIPLDTGTYEVTTLLQNSYWEKSCQVSATISLGKLSDTVAVNFPVRSKVACPNLEVNVATSKLTRCAKNIYDVSFCNRGTITAFNSYIILEFDEYFEDIAINLAGTQALGNNRFRCNLGNVPAGICGKFQISTYLDKNCNKTILGQTHTVSAHIYPDSICTAPSILWDGSSIEVTGECTSQEVIFRVKNVGKNKSTPKNGLVIIDDLVYLVKKDTIVPALNPNQIIEYKFPANGNSYRMNVDQAFAHPGNKVPTFGIEACGVNANGTFVTGFVLQFNENDGDPFVSTCRMESTGLSNKNDKIGFPKGFKNERYISDSTDIEYQISFKNTTGKTIDKVVVLDTISKFMDPMSVYDKISSHTFDLTYPEPNVMKFTFDNIFLKDSTVDGTASTGYIRFKLKQRKDKPDNTVILNKASIYFSGATVVQTNTVKHTTRKNFKEVLVSVDKNPVYEHVSVKVYPNPFSETTMIEVKGEDFDNLTFELYDMLGQKTHLENFEQNQLQFYRNGLNAGMYFFRITKDGKVVKTGKMVMQ